MKQNSEKRWWRGASGGSLLVGDGAVLECSVCVLRVLSGDGHMQVVCRSGRLSGVGRVDGEARPFILEEHL